MQSDYIFPYFYHDDNKPELQHREIIKNYSLQAEEMDNYIQTLPDANDIMEEIIEWRDNLSINLNKKIIFPRINRIGNPIESQETYPFIDYEARSEFLNNPHFENSKFYNNSWVHVFDFVTENTGNTIFLGYFTPSDIYPHYQTLNLIHMTNLESENLLSINPIISKNTFRTLSHCLEKISKRVRFTIVLPEDIALSFFSSDHFTIEPIQPGWSLIFSNKKYESAFLPIKSKTNEANIFSPKGMKNVKLCDTISVESTTINDFLAVIDDIIYIYGVKKIIVLYSGKSHNGAGTNFPVIPLKDYELNHPELLNVLKSKGLSLIIIGYNADNKLTMEPNDGSGRLSPVALPMIPDNVFDYKGILSFTGTSIGEQHYGYLFNLYLRQALSITNGDWLLSMQYLSNNEVLKKFNMKPYWTIDPGISSYKKWH